MYEKIEKQPQQTPEKRRYQNTEDMQDLSDKKSLDFRNKTDYLVIVP